MDLSTTETWRWIWLAAGAVFSLGEIAVAGTFFLLPFGIGAFAAAAVAFATTSLAASWVVFLLVSGIALALLVPLGRRLDRSSAQRAVGASRLVDRDAVVLADIPAGPASAGLVRVDREEWRAESADGAGIPAGTEVRVIRVSGTHLVVEPRRGR